MSLAIYVILQAFSWAGGADVPDAIYDWSLSFVSTADYSIVGKYPPRFASRNECNVNLRRGSVALPIGTYPACLPALR
jgi:hypothetical protein